MRRPGVSCHCLCLLALWTGRGRLDRTLVLVEYDAGPVDHLEADLVFRQDATDQMLHGLGLFQVPIFLRRAHVARSYAPDSNAINGSLLNRQ